MEQSPPDRKTGRVYRGALLHYLRSVMRIDDAAGYDWRSASSLDGVGGALSGARTLGECSDAPRGSWEAILLLNGENIGHSKFVVRFELPYPSYRQFPLQAVMIPTPTYRRRSRCHIIET